MNINLNLLPPIKKSRLEYVLNFLMTKDILEVIIIVFATLAITLIWSWMVLENQYSDLVSSAVLVNRGSYSYNQDIKAVNDTVKQIINISQEYYVISPKLIELISILPPDIKINSVQIDRINKNLTLSGTAKTREGLLNFQSKLQSIPWLNRIETPASQLFQKENINFQFTSGLKGFPPINSEQVQRPVMRDSDL